jgi:single-stranded-DNA-specific exonuclease
MALELESQNQERQKITSEIAREVRILAENSFKDKKFILASSPHWPIGVLGLVAGKIAEEFQKPTAVFRSQGDSYTGSFRSVPEINIIEIIGKCSDLLAKFGGHSQAAGVTVSSENFPKFYEKISALIEKGYEGKEIKPSLEIDREISADDISWELTTNIKKMEPFGMGNPEPVFLIKNIIVSDVKIVGNGSKHLKLGLRGMSGSPKIFEAIGFSLAERFSELKIGDNIDIVANIREDEWNGNHKIQLILIDLRPSL